MGKSPPKTNLACRLFFKAHCTVQNDGKKLNRVHSGMTAMQIFLLECDYTHIKKKKIREWRGVSSFFSQCPADIKNKKNMRAKQQHQSMTFQTWTWCGVVGAGAGWGGGGREGGKGEQRVWSNFHSFVSGGGAGRGGTKEFVGGEGKELSKQLSLFVITYKHQTNTPAY